MHPEKFPGSHTPAESSNNSASRQKEKAEREAIGKLNITQALLPRFGVALALRVASTVLFVALHFSTACCFLSCRHDMALLANLINKILISSKSVIVTGRALQEIHCGSRQAACRMHSDCFVMELQK